MRKEDARGIARFVTIIQRERLPRLQRHLSVGELPDAQLRPLEVGQNADRSAALCLDRADTLDQHAHRVVAGMAHIDAEEVCARFMQLLDRVFLG